MKIVMLPYNMVSEGARDVAKAIGVFRYADDAVPRFREPPLVLNWGKGHLPVWANRAAGWINSPAAVNNAINKQTALRLMHDAGVPAVESTTDRAVAEGWLRGDCLAVFCRTQLRGSEGAGIVVARRGEDIVAAPLYTKYARKKYEFRIHVMKDEMFYVTRKARRTNDNGEQLIRSGDGVYFKHLERDQWPGEAALTASVSAVKALGLDFGGVDVGVSERGVVKVYEVNTAPGVGPRTTEAYKQAFKRHYGEHVNRNGNALSSL